MGQKSSCALGYFDAKTIMKFLTIVGTRRWQKVVGLLTTHTSTVRGRVGVAVGKEAQVHPVSHIYVPETCIQQCPHLA